MNHVEHPAWCTPTEDGVSLTIRVVPGARRSQIVHGDGDQLRIRIAAPPVDGAANTELCRLLARTFTVRERDVEVVLGARSRLKTARIRGDVDHLITTSVTL